MLIKIRHGILGIANCSDKQSAIIINDHIILTSAVILRSYFKSYDISSTSVKQITEKLQNFQLVNTQDLSTDLNSLNFNITFDERQLDRSRFLTRYNGKPLYIFNSEDIMNYAKEILNNFDENIDFLISSFLILGFNDTTMNKPFDYFIKQIQVYTRYLNPVRKLDDILTLSSPFGMESFYKTITIGKVSNVVGQNDCLFIISNSLPIGCEGSAVFNNKLRLVGLIICTSFYRSNQNVNLTLAANFKLLLREFLRQSGHFSPKIHSSPIYQKPDRWQKSLVYIQSGNNQGTGTLVKIFNCKLIITCSHILQKNNNLVNCTYSRGSFISELLWKNESSNPYDIGILQAPLNIPETYFVKLSARQPHVGQIIYNAGYPFFTMPMKTNPSIFEGKLIKCSTGMLISDGSVQAGQSGGPMFDESGLLLGVCISNLNVDGVIYPNINTAVPIAAIRNILEEYAKTNDIAVLTNLIASKEITRIWNLENPPIFSKL